MGHIDLILNSKSRTPTSSLIEPEWELDSRVPEGKLTVEQFNWNDVGYDLVGPEDYVLRVYADQYGNLLYDDKGSVTSLGLNFNPDGDNTLVQGKAGQIIDFAGIDTATQGNSDFNRKGSYINTNYSPTLNNDAEFTWTLLFKADDNAVDQIEPTTGGNIFTTEPATGTTPTPFINISVIDVADGSNHNAFPAITISIRNAASTFKFGSSNINVFDTDWHRIVILSDNSELKIYVDGVLSELFNTSGSSIGFHLDSPGGTMENSNKVIINGKLQRYWHAETSDIRFYERALSTTEIATLGSTPDASVVYLNFASPLMILHTDGPTRDSLTTSITRSNKFQYIQLFVRESSAHSMRILQVRLLNNSGNNVFQDNTILVPTDATNSLAVGTNPSAKQVKASDDIADIIDNQALTDVAVGDTTDTLDEVVQLKLNRAYSFDEFRRLEVYFTDEQGPYEIRFLNENYELINNNVLYTSESPPSFVGTNNTLIILKMLGANPMTGFTAAINDTINTYVLAWADESTLTTDFKYRKVAAIAPGILQPITIPTVPRNRSLAMVLPRGYEKGVYGAVYTGQLLSDNQAGNANLSPQPGNINSSLDTNPRGAILGFDYSYYVDLVNGHRVYSTVTNTSTLTSYDVGNLFNGSANNGTRWIPNSDQSQPAGLVYDFTQTVALVQIELTNGDSTSQLTGDVKIYYYYGGWVQVSNQSPTTLNQTVSINEIVTFDISISRYWKVEIFPRNPPQTYIRLRNMYFRGYLASYTQGTYEPQYPLVGVQKQNDGTVGFKFEKSAGSAITETEIPSSYSLKCKICTC